jgi:alpha-methylacyl-CoA racemase
MLKPLKGVRVLDFTRLLPGPLCTLYMAQMGAEVIKIEPPEGDYTRFIPPLAKDNSYVYLQLNQHKEIQQMDLKDGDVIARLEEIIGGFDVLVESFRPGVMDSLGLGYEHLKKIHPKLVYCSITGYGQTGPLREEPGHDINYLGYAGILSQQGIDSPSLSNFQIADVAGGSMHGLVGILSALMHVQKEGQGCHVDVSMLDGAMALNQVSLATQQAKAQDISTSGDFLSGANPFYGIYETKDHRHMALGTLEKKFWKTFCTLIERKDLIECHSISDKMDPVIHSEIKEIFAAKTQRDWIKLLKNSHCCVTPVLTIKEAWKHEQVVARNLMATTNGHTDGEFKSYNQPIQFKV